MTTIVLDSDGVTHTTFGTSGDPAYLLSGSNITLINNGIVASTDPASPAISFGGSDGTIINNYMISNSGGNSVNGSGHADTLLNYWRIDGPIQLGDGNDRFEQLSPWRLGGTVDLGNGDDLFRLVAAQSEAGFTLDGGSGIDELRVEGKLDFIGGQAIVGVETLTIAGVLPQLYTSASQFLGFTGLRTITLTAGTSIIFQNSPNASADLNMADGTLSLANQSELQSVTGSAGAETVVLSLSRVSGAVNLLDGADVLRLSSDSAVGSVDLGSGDDTLALNMVGNAGNVVLPSIDGGAGLDTITIAGQFTTVFGAGMTAGFERLLVQAGLPSFSYTLDGFTGLSEVQITASPPPIGPSLTINFANSANPGADLMLNGNFANILSGSVFRSVKGGDFGEKLVISGSGTISSAIDLGKGDDTLWLANYIGELPAQIDLGAGYDTLVLDGATASNRVDLAPFAGLESITDNGDTGAGALTLVNGAGLDVIRFSYRALTLENFASPSARVEDYGGILTIGEGAVIGRVAPDPLTAIGWDEVPAHSQFDTIIVNHGAIIGNVEFINGNDIFDGSAGMVGGTVFGRSGDDRLIGGGGADRLDGGTDQDTLSGGLGSDMLDGGEGNDTIDGGEGNDTLRGGAGDDWLTGGSGNDFLLGGGGSDSLDGGTGDDRIISYGISVGGLLAGGDGNDVLELTGGNENTVSGGAGNDLFWLQTSYNTTLSGGTGIDTYQLLPNSAYYGTVITDFAVGEGGDRFDTSDLLQYAIGYSGGNPFSLGFIRLVQSGADTLLQWDSNGAAGSDGYFTLVTLLNVNAASLVAGNLGGYDPNGGASIGQTLLGTSGPDTLAGTSGEDVINGLAGDDRLTGDNGADVLDGGAGNDFLDGGLGNDTLFGGDGNDQLWDYRGNGADSLDGGGGDDYILSGGHAGSVLLGGSGNDTLEASSGNGSIVSGGTGNDIILVGAAARNTELSGGQGTDIYRIFPNVINPEHIISDFSVGHAGDIIDIDYMLSFTSFPGGDPSALGYVRLVQSGADTLLQWDNHSASDGVGFTTILTLQNVDSNALLPFNLGGYSLVTEAGPEIIQDARNDFNGDGRSDVIWRNDSGAFYEWLGQPNGGFVGNGNAYADVPASWHVAGTGDFNGDGRDDVIWRNDSGAVLTWQAQPNGSFVSGSYADVPTSWHVAGTGDFNGDGRDDVIWRNDSGAFTEWLGQPDGSLASNGNAYADVPASWHVAGTGDFNGDGRGDVIWRNDSGAFYEWLGQPNGGFVGNGNAYADVPASWHVAGTGDFNGDGRDDVIWRNDSGAVLTWQAQPNGSFVSGSYADVPTSWHVAGTGDFNGDGRDDVIWRNDSGAFTEWLGQPDGSLASNGNAYTDVATSWHVQSDYFIL